MWVGPRRRRNPNRVANLVCGWRYWSHKIGEGSREKGGYEWGGTEGGREGGREGREEGKEGRKERKGGRKGREEGIDRYRQFRMERKMQIQNTKYEKNACVVCVCVCVCMCVCECVHI